MYREYDEKTLDKLHNIQIEILDEIARICKKYNINYFLCGGSMLGAVRHHGFIPWDDDIDIGMSRKDYQLFIKYAKEELNNKYFLDCYETNEECYLPYAKVRKNGTIFEEEASISLNNHKGIFVDIFPIENADKEKSIKQMIQAYIVRNLTEAIFVKKKIKKIKNTNHPIFVRVLLLFNINQMKKMQVKLMTINKNDNSKYMIALAGVYNYLKETNLRETFLPTKEIEFEGKKYFGMNKPDKYLSRIYGNYMELPPIEKRVNHMPSNLDFGDKKKK